MDGLLLAIIVADTAGGLLCVRLGRFRHALLLGGVLVPGALVFATIGFAALARPGLAGVEQGPMLGFAYGSIVAAGLGTGWMLVVGIARAWSLRLESPRTKH